MQTMKPSTLKLTPCSTILPVKAESLQLFKTLQACYGNQTFTTIFITACHISPSSSINPVHAPSYFFNTHFNINLVFMPSSFTQSLSFRFSTHNSVLFFSPKVCDIPHPSNPPFLHQHALKP